MQMNNAIRTLVGEEQLEGTDKWRGDMVAANSSVYGIPNSARPVVKFNPVNKSMTHIGPDLGDGLKWGRDDAAHDCQQHQLLPYK